MSKKTLLQELRDRKSLAQKKPVIEFLYPDEDSPRMKVRAKRLAPGEIRDANKKIDGENMTGYFEHIWRRVLTQIESVHDMDGEEYNVKEITALIREQFNATEVVQFALQYSLALKADEDEADKNPNG